MDAHLPQRTARVTAPGWASESDWRRYRPVISELYQQDSLKKVMEEMETQHGFKATSKMYKTRVKQWRLDKKNKESDMKAIARKRAQRLSEGRTSSFHVRGRAVEFEEVLRYFGRKGVSMEEIAAEEDAPKTPTDVACLTPLILRATTPVPAPMRPPDEFVLPEQTLVLIQDYVKGSFDSGTWIRTTPRNHCYSVKDRGIASTSIISVNETRRAPLIDMDTIEDSCILACDLFLRRVFVEAGETLIYATAAIKQIV